MLWQYFLMNTLANSHSQPKEVCGGTGILFFLKKLLDTLKNEFIFIVFSALLSIHYFRVAL